MSSAGQKKYELDDDDNNNNNNNNNNQIHFD